jgi:uncharacterized membrane-anchored protein
MKITLVFQDARNLRSLMEGETRNMQVEISRMTNDIRSLTEQLNRKNAEIEKFNCIVTNMKIENEELLKENSRNSEQVRIFIQLKLERKISVWNQNVTWNAHRMEHSTTLCFFQD